VISPVNSGNKTDSIFSPKLSLIFGPWAQTELYLNGGFGFHSNDARGTTITVDPKTGDPAQRVTPLVRTKGAEIGARSTWIPGLNSTLAFWYFNAGLRTPLCRGRRDNRAQQFQPSVWDRVGQFLQTDPLVDSRF